MGSFKKSGVWRGWRLRLWESGAKVGKEEEGGFNWLMLPSLVRVGGGALGWRGGGEGRGWCVGASADRAHLERLGLFGVRWPAGKRHHLGPCVVVEAEKQLLSKAAGLVCTGGLVPGFVHL